jgi:hypothetical protein
MDETVYTRFKGDKVTDDMLDEAAKPFSENYGVWSAAMGTLAGGCPPKAQIDGPSAGSRNWSCAASAASVDLRLLFWRSSSWTAILPTA